MINQLRPSNRAYWLQVICEQNYERLQRLIPNLAESFQTPQFSYTLLNRDKYTLTIHFNIHDTSGQTHTQITCRVYLDTQSVEVLSINEHQQTLVRAGSPRKQALDNKWRFNFFFEKWLEYQTGTLTHQRKILSHSAVETT